MENMWIIIMTLTFHSCAGIQDKKNDVCPEDLVKETQTCFTEMAQAVQAESTPSAQTGTMTLNCKQIKKYCVESHCPLPEHDTCGSARSTLVSPARVRAAVPILCQKQDDIAQAGDCMNTVMSQDSVCKNQAYDKVKAEMSKSIRNVTMTFLIQCSFFNSLAACQREALSSSCGSGLGEAHAHFLLSFIPNSCSDNFTISSNSTLQDQTLSDSKSTTIANNNKISGSIQQALTTRKSEITAPEVSGNPNKTASRTEVKNLYKKPTNGSKQISTIAYYFQGIIEVWLLQHSLVNIGLRDIFN
ncbi:hypothetical protein Btru_042321 [Bulinus truncatus]|nr:hypothetical protein Btru_042321 [Bulinus truncatus]